jgi:glycosyltransferase involved in cell wall biosynthesis
VSRSKSAPKPKISLIIPVYNVEKYLAECLDSVINQTLREIEIICVNDGSTDSSSEILEQYANRDTRIKIINQVNSGLSVARNRGLDEAAGEYIQFVDSDDYITLETCQKLYEVAHRIPGGYDFIGFSGDVFTEESKLLKQSEFTKITYWRKQVYSPSSGNKLFCKLVMNDEYFVNAFLYVSKRTHLLNKGVRFEEGRLFEDNWFTYLNLIQAKRALILPDRLYHRRLRSDSIMMAQFSSVYAVSLWVFLNQVLDYIAKNAMTRLERAASIKATEWAGRKILEFIKIASPQELAEAEAQCNGFKLPPDFYPSMIDVATYALRTEQLLERIRRTPTFRVGQVIVWVPRQIALWIGWLIRKVRERN